MTNLPHLIGVYFKRMRSTASFDPIRDWFILLTVSTLALIGIIIWNIWAFDTVAAGGTIGTPATKTPAIFNNSSLDTIRSIFDKRAAEEEKYVTGAYRFADPSQ